MESKLMFLVVCVMGCAVSFIKAEPKLSTPTNLTSNISRSECGKTKLCLDNPKGCDPSGSSQCFFNSIAFSEMSLTVELSGNSTGYIALAGGDTSNLKNLNVIFVCGNNNSRFFFQTAKLINSTLEIINLLNVNNIRGSIQPSLIQCVFNIPIDINAIYFLNTLNGTNINVTDIANSQIPIFLDILKGSTNGTVLGAPTSVLESPVLINLANLANSTFFASIPASTTASTTVSSNASISLTSLWIHAAICLLGIFLYLI